MTGEPRARVRPSPEAAPSRPRASPAEPEPPVESHREEELRPAAGGREAVRGERLLDLGVGEDGEGPRVPLDALLQAEEEVGRGVDAATRRVVHHHREAGEAAERRHQLRPAGHVGQEAVGEDDVVRAVGERRGQQIAGDEASAPRARPLAHACLAGGVAAEDGDRVPRRHQRPRHLAVAAAHVEDARAGEGPEEIQGRLRLPLEEEPADRSREAAGVALGRGLDVGVLAR